MPRRDVRARTRSGDTCPESTANPKRVAVAAGLGGLGGLGGLAAAAASPALAHAGERGFILLLPTGIFQAGGHDRGRGVVSGRDPVSSVCAAPNHRGHDAIADFRASKSPGIERRGLCGARRARRGGALRAAAIRSRIPLPLSVWTLFWVGLTFAHAVLGYVWPFVNPWTALARLVRRALGWSRGDDAGVLVWPEALGGWPSVVLLVLFAWFELVHPAPQDPAILAFAVAGYSIFTVAGMALFGDRAWERNVEIFSRFFRIVSWIAPLGTVEERGARRLTVTFPGARLLGVGSLPAAGVVFVVVALATVSFDGLSRTFWWLDLMGENPLEHPGRTALVGRNTLGLAGAGVALLAAYAVSAAAGAWWSGSPPAEALRRFVVSIVPIAFGYHFAHYLPSFLVDAQYALKALSDPLGRGWNLLGARDLHVTASFLTHHASVELIWYAQTGAIVAAHVAAVVVLHGLAGGPRGGRLATIRSEIPLTTLMIGYTLFGLWLLSTPVAA